MTLEEARRIVADQDASDLARALEAVAIVLRFHGISDKRLLPIAEDVEAVGHSMIAADSHGASKC